MKKHVSLLLALCFTVSFAWAQNASRDNIREESGSDTPYVIVENASFNLVFKDADGKVRFEETTVVPYKVGQLFQWDIDVYSNLKTIAYKEESQLPRAPKKWRLDGRESTIASSVSKDGKTATVHQESRDGHLAGAWVLVKNDPKGKYQIRVYAEDRLIHTFHFEVK